MLSGAVGGAARSAELSAEWELDDSEASLVVIAA